MSIGGIDGVGRGGRGFIPPAGGGPPPPPGGPGGDGGDDKKPDGVKKTDTLKIRTPREQLQWLHETHVRGRNTYGTELVQQKRPPPDLETLKIYEQMPDLNDQDRQMLRELRQKYVEYEAGRLYREEIDEVPEAIQAEVAAYIAMLMHNPQLTSPDQAPMSDDDAISAMEGGAGSTMDDRGRRHQEEKGRRSDRDDADGDREEQKAPNHEE